MIDSAPTRSKPRWLNIAVWIGQILLLVAFGSAGFMKLTVPLDQLGEMMSFVNSTPGWLVTFIGVMEVLGAIGIIVPALTRIMPFLTPLAAAGFAIIQVLAIGVHANLGETAMTLPGNLVLLALSLFVAWGRFKAVPIAAR